MAKVQASVKTVRISTRKVRLVADAIRNMPVDQAMMQLQLVHKRAAGILTKVLKSAVANAVNNAKMPQDNLLIDSLLVDEGAFLKRFKPSTRGRVHPYKKRSTHITIVIKEREEKAQVVSAK